MSSVGNFHPEWGYLAPVPGFMRSARLVLVATAVGATAGAVVVLSLVERPAADVNKTYMTSPALVTRVEAATPSAAVTAPVKVVAVPVPVSASAAVAPLPASEARAPALAAPQPQPQIVALPNLASEPAKPPSTDSQPIAPALSEASTTSSADAPASVAALAEGPPATAAVTAPVADEAAVAPDAAPAPKKAGKKGHSAQGGESGYGWNAKSKSKNNEHGLGPILQRFFSARAGSFYSN